MLVFIYKIAYFRCDGFIIYNICYSLDMDHADFSKDAYEPDMNTHKPRSQKNLFWIQCNINSNQI